MTALVLLMTHCFLSLFCQSFFLHRYCSHNMFKMNKFWERFFYLLTFITQGPSFLNPTYYAILHRKHHKHSDTYMAPHSPINSKNIWQMMLRTFKHYKKILSSQGLKPELDEKINCPKWNTLDCFAESSMNIYMWIFIYISTYYLFNSEPIYYLLLPLHFLLVPIRGAIVNWFEHSVGYRDFSIAAESRNSFPVDLVLMGELYQNNHHKFGQKFNFAHHWFEIGLTYQISKIFSRFGIISIQGQV